MVLLGIETSCDETALSILETRGSGAFMEVQVIGSLVHSQAELHSAYGGVFPTLAKREHGKNLVPLLHKLLTESSDVLKAVGSDQTVNESGFAKFLENFKAHVNPQNPELYESFSAAAFLKSKPPIDAIAVTEGPGLEPALWVGITFAEMLSKIWNVPVIPVNHMEGHVVASLLPPEALRGGSHKLLSFPMPAVALLISGGHTQIVKVEDIGNYKVIGDTVDDAVGEAFDKVARLLKLPYPGGPYISMLASQALEEKIEPSVKLPRPMINSGDLAFSFSGLKTAVLYAIRDAAKNKDGEVEESWKKGLALEFERAVTETLDSKLRQAIADTDAKSIIVGGGVSANRMIRAQLQATSEEYGLPLFLPAPTVTGDNAVMIALAALAKAKTPGPAHSQIRAHGTKRL